MAQRLPIPPGFDDLSAEEKIEYLNLLWDRIAARAEKVPVPDWHRKILTERTDVDPGSKSWDKVAEDIFEELKSKD